VCPPDSQRCDCGYDFQLERQDASYLPRRVRPPLATFTSTAIWLLVGAVLYVAGSAANPPLPLMQRIGVLLAVFSAIDYVRAGMKWRKSSGASPQDDDFQQMRLRAESLMTAWMKGS
jgi:hypothetical protein